jgi:hypothetical protein
MPRSKSEPNVVQGWMTITIIGKLVIVFRKFTISREVDSDCRRDWCVEHVDRSGVLPYFVRLQTRKSAPPDSLRILRRVFINRSNH